jgi:ABC-type transport system involved in cytochrome c biogenesis permease subunit
MLQAVLDTNIWLATQVVAITTGYSAMFLADVLAIIYVIRGVFTRSLTKQTADSLARMTYGVVCFATLFSFVGTVLGGIWADQSWGRFWDGTPKKMAHS